MAGQRPGRRRAVAPAGWVLVRSASHAVPTIAGPRPHVAAHPNTAIFQKLGRSHTHAGGPSWGATAPRWGVVRRTRLGLVALHRRLTRALFLKNPYARNWARFQGRYVGPAGRCGSRSAAWACLRCPVWFAAAVRFRPAFEPAPSDCALPFARPRSRNLWSRLFSVRDPLGVGPLSSMYRSQESQFVYSSVCGFWREMRHEP